MPSHFADEPAHVALLRETMRRFVAEEMPPEKRQRWDREHRFPRALFEKLAASHGRMMPSQLDEISSDELDEMSSMMPPGMSTPLSLTASRTKRTCPSSSSSSSCS